jgi:enoyl-CoA hydratase/carnithine racemase
MEYETLLYERRGHVGVITLNRPDRLNAINQGLRSDVHAAVKAAHADDEVRVLIITGAGRGFCSGADLSGPRGPAGGPPAPADRARTRAWTRRAGSAAGPSCSPTSTSR